MPGPGHARPADNTTPANGGKILGKHAPLLLPALPERDHAEDTTALNIVGNLITNMQKAPKELLWQLACAVCEHNTRKDIGILSIVASMTGLRRRAVRNFQRRLRSTTNGSCTHGKRKTLVDNASYTCPREVDSLPASSVDGDECLPMSQDLPDLEEQLPLPQLPLPLPMHSQLSVTE